MRNLLICLGLIFFASPALARGKPVLVGIGDSVGVVAPLDAEDIEMFEYPADAEFGTLKKSLQLFFVPAVVWGGEPVIHVPSEDTVYTLDAEGLAYFEEKYGSASSYGGWIKFCNYVTGVVVALLVFLKFKGGGGSAEAE